MFKARIVKSDSAPQGVVTTNVCKTLTHSLEVAPRT